MTGVPDADIFVSQNWKVNKIEKIVDHNRDDSSGYVAKQRLAARLIYRLGK